MLLQRCSQQIFRCYHILKLQNRVNQALLSKKPFNTSQNSFTRTFISNAVLYKNNHQITSIRDVLQKIQRENRVNYSLIQENLPASNLKRDLSDDEIMTFLNYCSNSVPYYTKQKRNDLCQLIYKKLLEENNRNLELYHKYIQTCTDNYVKIDIDEFLANLTRLQCEPNDETFKLLLNNLGGTGDVNRIINVLNLMKSRQIALDEMDFNCIVQAHTIKGGLTGGESVLQTMRAALITESSSTVSALLKGLALRNDTNEFWTTYRKYQFKLREDNLLEILEITSLIGNLTFLKQVLNESAISSPTKDYILKIDSLCIHLINMQHPKAAMLIYESLVDPVPDKKYGHFLLREMLLCNIPVDIIIETSKRLRDKNLNPFSLENTTEIALRLKKFDIAARFLDEFQHLRPQFFWPFIIEAYRKKGQSGIFDVLQRMLAMNVKLDRETLYNYVIPNCDLKDPKLLMKTLQNYGCTVKDILPCLLIVLLENNQIGIVQELCDSYSVQIYDDKLLKLLPAAWHRTKQLQPIVTVLQRLREADQKNEELIANFLMRALKYCTTINDFNRFHQLIQEISNRKLRISTASTDILLQNITKNCPDPGLCRKLTNSINDLEDLTMQPEQHQIVHPRDMNLEQLECHLIELKTKKMETRGVLRKLIQQYSNIGNFERLNQLRDEFLRLNYEETPGMKASMMFAMVQCNNLELALKFYQDLKSNCPNFQIDNFKIIDLITLMVKNQRFTEAKDCLIAEAPNSTKMGDQRSIVRNCWNLLTAFKDPHQQQEIFDLLLMKGYCKPSNILLGPLIRIHLENGDIEKASRLFVDLANKYHCTPLQVELISNIVETENWELLQQIIDVSVKIHGEMATNMAVVAAMAEKSLEKPLIKYLSKITISNAELTKRCNRWIEENKLEPLLVLERASRNIRDRKHVEIIQVSIMKIYGLRNDCEAALEFYEELYANERLIGKILNDELINLLNKCKYEIPEQIKLRLFNK